MSHHLDIQIDAELLDWLDYYCSIYGIDRDTAISHLLAGALQTSLPNPEWFQQDEISNDLPLKATIDNKPEDQNINEFGDNHQSEFLNTKETAATHSTKFQSFSVLRSNPLINRRFNPSR